MDKTLNKIKKNIHEINILKIEEETYKNLLTKDVTIHSVFTHSINLYVGETLVTIGSNISFSKNHIVVDSVDFEVCNVSVASMLKPVFQGFSIDEFIFRIEENSVVKAKPYNNKKDINEGLLLKAKALLEWIGTQETISIMHFDKTEKVLSYQFRSILDFLENENKDSGHRLVGLGIGLTPLGDDVLLGYILAKRSQKNEVKWLDSILELGKRNTNIISYQSYKDVFEGYYTDQFANMINEFFDDTTFNYAKEVIRYGATSGGGILIGFIFGLLPQGGIRNECLESVRKHIL